jgi:branched-chain amino acid transport system substrate-binding protein
MQQKGGRGTADEFSNILKDNGTAIGLVERMDQGAQDMKAQLVKFKGSGADTLFVTTAVEQLSLVLKQAASLGLNLRIISTGGSQNPDQLITNVGKAADGTWHLVFFALWAPEATPDRPPRRPLLQSGTGEGCHSEDLPRAFAVMTASGPSPRPSRSQVRRIRAALWKVAILGLNGPINSKRAAAGTRQRAEHAERLSGEDRQRQGHRSEDLEQPNVCAHSTGQRDCGLTLARAASFGASSRQCA